MDGPRYTAEQKDESQNRNVKGKKQVTKGAIHNDSIVIKLKNRKNETIYTFVINIKKSQRMINVKFSLVVSEEEHIGSFRGTKNVLFKIDSSYMAVYLFSRM